MCHPGLDALRRGYHGIARGAVGTRRNTRDGGLQSLRNSNKFFVMSDYGPRLDRLGYQNGVNQCPSPRTASHNVHGKVNDSLLLLLLLRRGGSCGRNIACLLFGFVAFVRVIHVGIIVIVNENKRKKEKKE